MKQLVARYEIISNTAVTVKGAKSVVLKTGHEKSKVTITLAVKANSDKLKPYIVFPRHEREIQNSKKDPTIKNRCYVESAINVWNENTTIDWVENGLKTCTFGKMRFFAWDSFRAHLVQSVKKLLNKEKIDPFVIPGGATGHIQGTGVLWKKPIKDQLREMCDQWMDEGSHIHTKEGNMRRPPLKQIVQWILKAWSDLDKEIIIKSFRCCALSIQGDGSDGNETSCFKPGKPLSSGFESLKAAMAEAAKELVNPFTESDVENDPDLVIDSDRKKMKTLILSKQ